jgi:sialic acid synthase SpsE
MDEKGGVMREINIDGRSVGQGHPTFVVAEAGINHGGDLKAALKMVDEAAQAGADAIKFQSYITEKRVREDDPVYNYLKWCELDEQSHWEIQGFCREKEITFMSTAFDDESIQLLTNMNVPVIKIASFDIVNLYLLRAIAETKIPVIISTGMADTEEVDRGVDVFERNRVPYALLHCISAYPADDRDLNLRVMTTLKEWFDCPVGFSDHTLGTRGAVYSIFAGADIIEKHFTLDKEQEGPDHKLSVEPSEFKVMVEKIREAEVMLGSSEVKLFSCEEQTMPYRRYSD